jgi:hypothetical protein
MSVPPNSGQEQIGAEAVTQEGKPVTSEPYLLADVYNPAQYQEDIDETLRLSSYVPEMNMDEVM